jgi:hypothetical protein
MMEQTGNKETEKMKQQHQQSGNSIFQTIPLL